MLFLKLFSLIKTSSRKTVVWNYHIYWQLLMKMLRLHPGAIHCMMSDIWLHAWAFFLAIENHTGSLGGETLGGTLEERLVSLSLVYGWSLFWSSNTTEITANNALSETPETLKHMWRWNAMDHSFRFALIPQFLVLSNHCSLRRQTYKNQSLGKWHSKYVCPGAASGWK